MCYRNHLTSSGVPPLSSKKPDHQILQSFEPPLVPKAQGPYKQHAASPPSLAMHIVLVSAGAPKFFLFFSTSESTKDRNLPYLCLFKAFLQ